MRAKYIKKENNKLKGKEIMRKRKIKKDKIAILGLLFLCIFYNIHGVYAFDFPSIPDNYFIQDKANVLSVETENIVNSVYSSYKENKNIDSSLVTIADPVGDKEEYTKQLKQWWKIGDKNNGFMIAIYPESKDTVEMIFDKALTTYISNADVNRYKEKINNGVINNNLDVEIKEIIQDIEIKLKDYTKKDTFMEYVKSVFDNIMFNLKPKKGGSPFEKLFNAVTRKVNKS